MALGEQPFLESPGGAGEQHVAHADGGRESDWHSASRSHDNATGYLIRYFQTSSSAIVAPRGVGVKLTPIVRTSIVSLPWARPQNAGEILSLTIDGPGLRRRGGVGRADGYVVFVPGRACRVIGLQGCGLVQVALPGSVAGVIEAVLEPSPPSGVEAPCAVFRAVRGVPGCSTLAYGRPARLQVQGKVVDALERLGGPAGRPGSAPIIGRGRDLRLPEQDGVHGWRAPRRPAGERSRPAGGPPAA